MLSWCTRVRLGPLGGGPGIAGMKIVGGPSGGGSGGSEFIGGPPFRPPPGSSPPGAPAPAAAAERPPLPDAAYSIDICVGGAVTKSLRVCGGDTRSHDNEVVPVDKGVPATIVCVGMGSGLPTAGKT